MSRLDEIWEEIDKILEAKKAVLFVRHIEKHLKEEKIEGKVMCKICNKDIDEIHRENKGKEI